MAPRVAVNVAEVSMRYDWDNQRVENVFHVRKNEGADSPDLPLIATAFDAWHENYLVPLQSNSLKLREIYVVDITTPTSPAHTEPILPARAGARSSASLPNSVTLAVSLRTAQRGRSHRGRSYVLGLCEDQIALNQVDPATVTLYLVAYEQLRQDLITAGHELVVTSFYTAGAPRASGLSTDVTSISIVDDVVDTQRRRLPGRGL